MSSSPTNWSSLGTQLAGPAGLVTGLAGAAGAFPTVGNSSGTTNSVLNTLQSLFGNTNTNTSGTTSSTQTSGYGPEGEAAVQQLLPMIGQLSKNVNLAPYQQQQTEAINNQSNAQKTNVDNEMAARGLSTSPAAATAAANIQAQRSGAITNLNQQIPLLQNQLTQSNAGSIAGILNMLPKVTSGTGTTNQTQVGTTSQSGSSNQTGNTTQQAKTSSGGGIGGVLGGIGGALAALL